MTLSRVISGGQIGADIAGLMAAHEAGIETGGWMPKGFKTKNGPLDPYLVGKFNLQEMLTSDYPTRTAQNVVASDATIRFAYNWYSPGEKLTQRLLTQHKKPRWDVELRKYGNQWSVFGFPPDMVAAFAHTTAAWIESNKFRTINVAGNGDESITLCVVDFLKQVFSFLPRETT